MKIYLIQPKARAVFKSPPLGLRLVATILKQNGFNEIYDIDPNKGDDPYGINYSHDTILVGISITFMTVNEAFNLARHIKTENPDAVIIFGGPQATLMPEESINSEWVDIVALGEGEFTMLELAERLTSGKELQGIKGIWYKNLDGQILKNEPREFIKDLNTLPITDRSFFTDTLYQKGLYRVLVRKPTWYIMTSQSCPYHCRMCQPALKKIAGPWRQRSVDSVIEEIEFLKNTYNAGLFSFYDNDMGIDRKWMVDFCRRARQIDNISMICCGRANLLDYELLNQMKEAGFVSLSWGAESGSDRVLREIMNKKTSVQMNIDFANNCYELKINANAFWMLANPGETIEEMKETIQLASELPVYYAHFHIASPNPGTHYYLDAQAGGYLNLNSWDDVDERSRATILQSNVSREDIVAIDQYLIETMVKKGWNYELNGHTLSFYNTRVFTERHPSRVLGRAVLMFVRDRRLFHVRNAWLGIKHWLGFSSNA